MPKLSQTELLEALTLKAMAQREAKPMGGVGSGRKRPKWATDADGKRTQVYPAPSPSTSDSESSSEKRASSDATSNESPPNLPPPRKPNPKNPNRPSSHPPLWTETYRKVPEDDKEREDAFKAYRFYSRSLTGAWSKLLELASDEPADADERAAANDAICLTMYQLNLTMLDWRLSLPIALGSPLISRMPAIQKKWFQKRAEDEKPPEKEVAGVRLSTVPSQGGS